MRWCFPERPSGWGAGSWPGTSRCRGGSPAPWPRWGWVCTPSGNSSRSWPTIGFAYLVLHFYDLKPITLIMIGLGAALSYYLGKDAGFLAPRKGKLSAPTGGPGE